uniref:Secreted protein n=1 Tax=Meloidogyne incognita TaxID=6306 RepID=A0A914M1F9_MELIC
MVNERGQVLSLFRLCLGSCLQNNSCLQHTHLHLQLVVVTIWRTLLKFQSKNASFRASDFVDSAVPARSDVGNYKKLLCGAKNERR